MPNIEDKLKHVRFRGLDGNERDAAWRAILTKKAAPGSQLSFNFALRPMTALIIALAVLFSGTGIVAASNDAKPGDALFGVDLAVERVRMSLASDDNRNELARTFAQERLEEIQNLRDDDDSDDDSDDDASSTQSTAGLTEAEAEVFTNETVVKLEINDRKFGFVTQAKTREALVTEIVTKYSLEKATVEAKLVVQTEDRASRPDDKTFLNSETRAERDISLDDDEKHDIEVSLNQVLKILAEDNASSSAELRAALQGILDSSVEGKIKFESDDQKVEFKFKDGSIEMKVKSEDNSDDDSDDEDAKEGDDDSDDRFKVRLSGTVGSSSDDDGDEDEDDRSASSSDDDSDDDSDNDRSGSGRDSDDDSDDSDDKDDDEDNSGRDSDDGEDDEDDEDEVEVKIKL